MARREAPVKPGRFQDFARDLRALRAGSGMTYRQLSDHAAYSPSALSAAASGAGLPTLEVTLAFVRACGGDEQAWRARWQQLAAARHVADPVTAAGDADPRSDPTAPVTASGNGTGPTRGGRSSWTGGGWRVPLGAGVLVLALGITIGVLVADRGGDGSPAGRSTDRARPSGTGGRVSAAPGTNGASSTWTAYSGPECASADKASTLSTFAPHPNRPWLRFGLGGPAGFPGCGKALYSAQRGRGPDSWSNEVDWVFHPGKAVRRCRFRVYVPPGQWATKVLYKTFPGDVANGYKGDAIASVVIDQARYDRGGWADIPGSAVTTGVVDLSVTDASATSHANLVAHIAQALCT